MGDPDHLLPLTEGIHGSTVIEVLKTSMVGEGGSSDSGSGLKKQQLETSTEALEDNQSNLIKSDLKTGEWVNAVQGKKKLTKYEMDIQIEDEVETGSVDTTENKKEDIMDILEKSVGSNKSAKNTIKEAGEEIWREVSPGKVSRTPQTNKKFESGQVSILSNSRFSVLSQDEEEGEIMKNKEEVVEVNKEEKRGNELEKEDDNEDLEKETTIVDDEDGITLRRYLPRGSKNNHREQGTMARVI
ncbi:hypothetical protein Rs2_33986 [Raphanus sativus]|nr:hypothetical protein Rs2_33986 [Raphanus sativus]